MNYSHAISRAFRSLRSGPLWGFTASALAAIVAVYAAAAAVATVGFGASLTAVVEAFSSTSTPSLSTFTPVFILYGALFGAALVSLPLVFIMRGGLVSLTDSAVSGKPLRVADGWTAGARYLGRVFAIDMIIGLVTALAISVVVGILFALILATSRGSNVGAGAAFGVCCGMGLYLLLLVGLVLIVGSYEALAVRYGVIGGRSFSDALSAALTAFRVAWKNVVVFALIVIGFGIVFQAALSMVVGVLELVLAPSLLLGTAGSDPSVLVRQVLRVYSVVLPVSFVLGIPWTILQQSLWTAFFRQLTGLDAQSAPPAPPEATLLDAPAPSEPVLPEPPSPPAPPVLTLPDAPAPPVNNG